MTTPDRLDEMLRTGAPRVSAHSPSVNAAVVRLATETQLQERSRRYRARPLVVVLASVVLAGGGATAAAAAGAFQWHPWAENPDASFAVAMPSGDICDYRVGGIDGASTEVVEAVRVFVAEHDVLAMADVDRVIAEARADGLTMYDENGELHPAGPGTEYYNADFEYQSAINLAVAELIRNELQEQGILAPYTLNMQADCGEQ